MASYEHKLRAVGRLLDARVMRDVAFTETPTGLVVTGLGRVVDHSGEERWHGLSFDVAADEIDEVLKNVKKQPGSRWRPW